MNIIEVLISESLLFLAMAEEEGGAEDTSFLRTVISDHIYYIVDADVDVDGDVDVDDEDTSLLRRVCGDHVVVYVGVDEVMTR